MNVYSSIIYNNQKLKTSQISVSDLMNRPQCIHTTKHYSAVKRNTLVTHATAGTNLMGIMLSGGESQFQKVYTLYGSIYITFLK